MIKSKKAITLTPNEIIELILAIAGMFLLIWLFISLVQTGWDVNKETAKSYMATLEKETKKADSGKTGEFSLWQPDGKVKFYLVYFADKRKYDVDGISFKRKMFGFGSNAMCLCYVKEKIPTCESCISLGYDAKFIPEKYVAYGTGSEFRITRDDNAKKYLFSVVKSSGSLAATTLKQSAVILGKQREIIAYISLTGEIISFIVRDLSSEEMGGYGDLAGDYKLDVNGKVILDKNGESVDVGTIYHLAKGDTSGENLDYLIPVEDGSQQNIEALREIRKGMENKKEDLKLKITFSPALDNLQEKKVETTMKLTKDGLIATIPEVGEVIYSNGKLFSVVSKSKDILGEISIQKEAVPVSQKNNEIIKGFEDSLSSSENQFSMGEDRFSLGLSYEKINNEAILYIDDNSPLSEKNALDSHGLITGVNYAGEIYEKLKDDVLPSAWTDWKKVWKGKEKGMYIYLSDEDAKKKSAAVSKLKSELMNLYLSKK